MKSLGCTIVLLLNTLCITGTANAGVLITPLDPVAVDTAYLSTSGTTPALIDFVNQTAFSVDVYWINYSGDRVFYNTLAAGTSYFQNTYITHPWLIVETGTGGTTAQGTGTLIDAFLAVTPTSSNANADTAVITTPAITASPEPSTFLLVGALIPLAFLLRNSKQANAV